MRKWKGCKHLDYEDEYIDCKIIELPDGMGQYWERGETWTDGGANPKKVQFCGQGRGRINGIFQCINPGEMPCYEPQEEENANREN